MALVNRWIEPAFAYGPFWVYCMIFLACFIENIIPPFPGDSFILAAGALVALGRLDYFPTIAVVVAGGMGSVVLLYLFGRKYGRAYVIRKNFRFFSAKDVISIEKTLQKWGAALLLVSRFLFGIRSALAVVAGIANYPLASMILFSLLSYLCFVLLWIYLASEVVTNAAFLDSILRTYDMIIWPLAGVLAAWFLIHRLKLLKKEPT